ncbi:hypothetical protein XFF6990_200247 [Xanthomonas citri pv. fuscans]|nr:hypothetical protein XFF6990_200247 [Xanthomonas citri pv. fuscans]
MYLDGAFVRFQHRLHTRRCKAAGLTGTHQRVGRADVTAFGKMRMEQRFHDRIHIALVAGQPDQTMRTQRADLHLPTAKIQRQALRLRGGLGLRQDLLDPCRTAELQRQRLAQWRRLQTGIRIKLERVVVNIQGRRLRTKRCEGGLETAFADPAPGTHYVGPDVDAHELGFVRGDLGLAEHRRDSALANVCHC